MKNYPTREAARSALLIAALQEAQSVGYQMVTLGAAAARCGRTAGWACTLMQADELQDALMRAACEGRVLRVIAQGLATGHAVALALPEDVRRAAVEAVV